jgi:acyl dehydratase
MLESNIDLKAEGTMEERAIFKQGLYFEEYNIGDTFVTPGRTITEADVVNFAGVSGDFTSIHTDADYARSLPFGQRVAHGLLVISVITGLATRSGFMEGTVLALREIIQWKFSQPVFIGDTIHAEFTVMETKTLARLGGGAVILEVGVKNQDEQLVMKGRLNVLFQSRS